ncbi:MAG: alpha/beta hydrolase fold domain-containing protein [Saprospiraceae bacterium]
MHVYKQYDQAALNHQYNNSELVPHFQQYYDLWAQLNRDVISEYTMITDIPYGPGYNHKLDIYPAYIKHAPTMIFIHGGYWQKMDRSDFRFIATAFVPYNINTIIIGYPLAPAVGLDEIISSVRHALTWIHHHVEEYGGDADSLYLCGHSAGGHLAAMMMTRKFKPDDIDLKGVYALSGLYNLIPIQLSHVNGPMGMDEAISLRCSPIQYIPDNIALTLAVGGDESEEYHCQMKDLFNTWTPHHKNLKTMVLPGVNHFSILSELINPESILFKSILNMIRGAQ